MTELERRFAAIAGQLPTGPAEISWPGESGAVSSLAAHSLSVVSTDPPLISVSVSSGPEVDEVCEVGSFTVRPRDGAGAGLGCKVESAVAVGEHQLLIGRVDQLDPLEEVGRRSLLFSHGDSEHLIAHLPSQVRPVEDLVTERHGVGHEMPAEPLATIVIIGGGASGTLTAVQLLRRSAPGLKVVLVERSGKPGPGVAYGTEDVQHRLNVPAGQMIGLPDRPFDFLDWVRREHPETEPREYLARGTFGIYLTELLEKSVGEAPGVFFERVTGEAVGVDEAEPGLPLTVRIDNGQEISADRVVLALGNGRPAIPPGIDSEVIASDRFVADPWYEGALDAALADDSVLLIGTGLTMVDIAISLGGPGGPDIHAVSRHGLLPRAHGDTMPIRGRPVALPDDRCSLTELTSRLLTEIAVAGARGQDWRIAFDSLRPITNDLWQSLDRRDQKRFVSDLGRIWGVHRHRMAPRVALRLERLKVNRRLRVRAASIRNIEIERNQLAVNLSLSNADAAERLVVDRVINCTGPTWDPRRLDQSLVVGLREDGRLRADPLGIGFDVDEDGALIDREANPSRQIFAIGPVRNGVLLETTAVPEIGRQAELLADLLLSGLSGSLRSTRELNVA